MKRKISGLASILATILLLAPECAANNKEIVLKHEGYTVSLDLKFSKVGQNPFQRIISFLDWGPNGFATGFVVGDGLVMTAYHVVSGDLSNSKRTILGFSAKDKLKVDVVVNGCQATVLMVDEQADLALLRACRSSKQMKFPVFQANLSKDEKVFLVARPHGSKIIKRGLYYGPYIYRGQEYWSAKIDGRDGFSGSPVYNDKGEIVGVISDYIWSKQLAVMSPGIRAQKLLEDYTASTKP
jgi:hypothetical protein